MLSFLHAVLMNASLVLLGLYFIESNLASATDEEQQSPVGFNIIFPAMIESAMNFGMHLPLGAPTLDALFHRRDFELKRYVLFSLEEQIYTTVESSSYARYNKWNALKLLSEKSLFEIF